MSFEWTMVHRCEQAIPSENMEWDIYVLSISSWHKFPVLIANLLFKPEKMSFSNSGTIYIFIMRQEDWEQKDTLVFSRHYNS